MTPLLEASGVSLENRLEPTDLSIERGQLVAIIGPNGSGKTSLLRALSGVQRGAGHCRIAGEELILVAPQRRPSLATFLPASRDVVWPISAREVIALGLPKPDLERVDELIEMLELTALVDRPIDQLSTGERARVLLARALGPRPHVLLLDEPLSNLDPYWVLRILEILRDAVKDGRSALVSLHDIDRSEVFDRVLLMDRGMLKADLEPAGMIASDVLSQAFRIEKKSGRWSIRPGADRQSLP